MITFLNLTLLSLSLTHRHSLTTLIARNRSLEKVSFLATPSAVAMVIVIVLILVGLGLEAGDQGGDAPATRALGEQYDFQEGRLLSAKPITTIGVPAVPFLTFYGR